MSEHFAFDDRLGMKVPQLMREWSEYTVTERERILEDWETLRGGIPALITRFENEINDRHERLQAVDDWNESVELLSEINDYASRINDLNILFRTQPDIELESDDAQEHHDRDK